MFHVLHRRVPKFEHAGLTRWWNHATKLYRFDEDYLFQFPILGFNLASLCRWRVIQYYLTRAHGNLELIDQLDLIGRTGELAKLFGIQGGDLTIY